MAFMRFLMVSGLGPASVFTYLLCSLFTALHIWEYTEAKECTHKDFFKLKWKELRTTRDYNILGAAILFIPALLVYMAGYLYCFVGSFAIRLRFLVNRWFRLAFKNRHTN